MDSFVSQIMMLSLKQTVYVVRVTHILQPLPPLSQKHPGKALYKAAKKHFYFTHMKSHTSKTCSCTHTNRGNKQVSDFLAAVPFSHT